MFLIVLKVLLSCAERVTTGTYSFVSFVLNAAFFGLLIPATAGSASGLGSLYALLVNTQFLDHVRVKDSHN